MSYAQGRQTNVSTIQMHFTPTCFGITMPSSGSTRRVENH